MSTPNLVATLVLLAIGVVSNDVLSVAFTVSSYEGGAHGNYYTTNVNYDLNAARTFALADLFRTESQFLARISALSIASLKEDLGQGADMAWIQKGPGRIRTTIRPGA